MDLASSLDEALLALGELLEDRELTYDLAVVGGGALLLRGLIRRPTKDLDVIALVEDGELRAGRPFPAPLAEAVRDVGRAFGLADDWVNPGPTDQLAHGLPAGFRERLDVLGYGGLTLRVASRFDLICLKLHAATDDGPGGKHFADLCALAPDDAELLDASSWVATQDALSEWPTLVGQVVARVREVRDAR